MAIKAKFDARDVSAAISARLLRIDAAVTRRLSRLGEECVNHARTTGDFIDRTGNLRNSMGYVIVKNGQIIHQNFKRTANITTPGGKRSKGSKSGMAAGQELASNLAENYHNGYALIVVAGMGYAAYVEARGRNVLAGAEHLAQQEMPRMISELKSNIMKMK